MCQFGASCPISLKRHITRNHKQEVMRSSLDDNSLDISIRSDQREHDISYLNRKVKMSYSPPLHPLPNTLTPTPLKNFLKNVLSLKSTKKFQKVPKSIQKYPKVPKSTQKYPKVPQKYPKVQKSTQKYAKVPKSTQKVPKSTKKYQKVPKSTKIKPKSTKKY